MDDAVLDVVVAQPLRGGGRGRAGAGRDGAGRPRRGEATGRGPSQPWAGGRTLRSETGPPPFRATRCDRREYGQKRVTEDRALQTRGRERGPIPFLRLVDRVARTLHEHWLGLGFGESERALLRRLDHWHEKFS